MATKPTYYPEWAIEDTNLPATGQANKARPKESLRLIGFDKGQLQTAEEWNWILNNLYLWTQYYDESISENLDSFLPKMGTKITFQGKATGLVDFNGEITNTVNLTIADLDNATNQATANTLVKRGVEGGANFQRNIHLLAGPGLNADYWLEDQAGVTKGSFAWDRTEGLVTIYYGDTTNKLSYVNLRNGYVDIYNPRTTTPQQIQAESLTRRDYVDQSINDLNTSLTTSINNLNTSLTNAINSTNTNVTNLTTYVNDTFVKQIRLGTRGEMIVRGDLEDAPAGSVFVGGGDFGSDDGTYAYRPLQYLINSTWITAGVV